MYSRFSGQPSMPEKPIQIPEHYSGCAFSQGIKPSEPPKPEKQAPPAFLEVAKPTPPEKAESEEEPNTPIQWQIKPNEDLAPVSSHPTAHHQSASPFSNLFGSLGSAFPFSHGLGFEELLILGLIIMLSRNENESDIVLLLGLLLFCG